LTPNLMPVLVCDCRLMLCAESFKFDLFKLCIC
jgi:hypothetical protein